MPPFESFGIDGLEGLEAQTTDELCAREGGVCLGTGNRSVKSRAIVTDSASPQSSQFSVGSRAGLLLVTVLLTGFRAKSKDLCTRTGSFAGIKSLALQW